MSSSPLDFASASASQTSSLDHLLLAIGAEIRSWEDGATSADEAEARIAILVRSAEALMTRRCAA